jgi:hypothetical protein
MNRWGKLAYGIRDHRGFVGLPRQDLGVAIWAIAWSGENLLDGFIPEGALPLNLADSPGSTARLVSRGLWEPVEGGYQIHHFSDYNEVRSKVETDREANHAARVLGGQRAAQRRLETTGSALQPGASNHPDRQAAPAPVEIESQADRQAAPKVDVDVDVRASSRTRSRDDDLAVRCPQCQVGQLKQRRNGKTGDPFLACTDREGCKWTYDGALANYLARPKPRRTEALPELPDPSTMAPIPADAKAMGDRIACGIQALAPGMAPK